jgi:small subunit ribosomal protein S4
VNGKVVDISSYQLKPGDMVGVREKSKSLEIVTNALSSNNAKKFNWLNWDGKEMNGTFMAYPERDQIPENIKEQLIVELYSK